MEAIETALTAHFERAPECSARCQYAEDVAMPEYECEDECQYLLRTCERCGGEGRLYSGHPNDPDPRDDGECPHCDGEGVERLRDRRPQTNHPHAARQR